MNTWGNDQFAMQNIIHGVPNMIPQHGMAPPHAMAPPMVQPYTIIGDQNMQMQPIHVTHVNPAPPTGQFIGPVIPENANSQVETIAENEDKSNDQDQTQTQEKRQSRERNDRRERERERGWLLFFFLIRIIIISVEKYSVLDLGLTLAPPLQSVSSLHVMGSRGLYCSVYCVLIIFDPEQDTV